MLKSSVDERASVWQRLLGLAPPKPHRCRPIAIVENKHRRFVNTRYQTKARSGRNRVATVSVDGKIVCCRAEVPAK